jgi:hypothetical protein
MDDAYTNDAFRSIHTLRRRIGTSRHVEAHPYQPVLAGLCSLRGERTAGSPGRRRFRPELLDRGPSPSG